MLRSSQFFEVMERETKEMEEKVRRRIYIPNDVHSYVTSPY